MSRDSGCKRGGMENEERDGARERWMYVWKYKRYGRGRRKRGEREVSREGGIDVGIATWRKGEREEGGGRKECAEI